MVMSKIVSLTLCLLMLSAIMPAVLEAGVPAPPPVAPGTITYVDGDWNVNTAVTYSDQVIVLNGNLNILAGGVLSFSDVTLMMNCTTDGQFGIEVRAGGAFYLNDTDGDPTTSGDASLITNGMTAGQGYNFKILSGAIFEARNSHIEKCGLLAGTSGAQNSGMRVLSNDAVFENVTISGGAIGLTVDSCSVSMSDCAISGNLFYGIFMIDAAVPGTTCGAVLNGTAVSDNGWTGIMAMSNAVVDIEGGVIDGNRGGIRIICDYSVDLDMEDCEVSDNGAEGGIWLDGTSIACEIRADITGCSISGNGNTPVRLGFSGTSSLTEVPVKSVYLNMTGNSVLSDDSNVFGVLYVLATDTISANLTGNDFLLPYVKYGIHIGRVIDTLNTMPAAKKVYVVMQNNNLSLVGGGVLSLCAIENLTATVVKNHVFNSEVNEGIGCGAVSIGWFTGGMDDTTPENLTLVMKQNTFDDISEDGAVGIKAIYNIWADIGDNNIFGAIGGGLRLGWLDDEDANVKYSSEAWSKPTRNVRARIYNNFISGGSGNSIWLYSSNSSEIFSNMLDNKPYSGDGIRIQASRLPTKVYSNQVTAHNNGSGLKLEQASNVSVYFNTFENNLYGMGFERGSHDNIIFNNLIRKPNDKYGFYFATDSLDNVIPANNTVNGTALKKFHDLHGASGSLVQITGNTVSWPRMSNLGQMIVSNSSFLDLFGNQASNGIAGIALVNVQSSLVRDNILTSGSFGQNCGISLQYSTGNIVRQNTVTNNGAGIGVMSYSAGNSLWENEVNKAQESDIGISVDPNGSAFANEISGNNTVNTEPVQYFFGDPQVSLDGPDISVGNLTNLGQIFIAQCTDVSISNAIVRGGITGVTVRDAVSLCLSNVTVRGASASGLSASSVGAADIRVSNISGAAIGADLYDAHASFNDSNLDGATPANVVSGSSLRLVNTTQSGGTASVSIDSTMTAEWYLDIMAESSGIPLPGAQVNLTSVNGSVAVNETTADNGTIPTKLLLQYSRTGDIYDNRTPYNLNVTRQGYSTYYLPISLDRSTSVVANLSDVTAPIMSPPTIGPDCSIGTSASTIWINATLDDRLTGNNTVVGAEYIIVTWAPDAAPPPVSASGTAMSALDGALDSPFEPVTAEVDVSDMSKGRHVVWVRGMDAMGNLCLWSPVELNVSDDEAPVALSQPTQSNPANMSIGTVWFNATFSDAPTGISNIIAAEWTAQNLTTAYQVGGSAISRPQDGSFNEPEEDISVKFIFNSLVPGDYAFRVRATDSAGHVSQWAELEFTVTDDIAPSAPQGLTASNTTRAGELVIAWIANAEPDLAGYVVYRSTTPGTGFVPAATVDADGTQWTDTGLANDTVYYYRITAYDSAVSPNESPRSNEASARTIAGIPDGPSANDGDVTSLLTLAVVIVVIAAIAILVLMLFLRKRAKPKE